MPISVLSWENYWSKLKMMLEKIGEMYKLEIFLMISPKIQTEKAWMVSITGRR